jgi:hypothetical protein
LYRQKGRLNFTITARRRTIPDVPFVRVAIIVDVSKTTFSLACSIVVMAVSIGRIRALLVVASKPTLFKVKLPELSCQIMITFANTTAAVAAAAASTSGQDGRVSQPRQVRKALQKPISLLQEPHVFVSCGTFLPGAVVQGVEVTRNRQSQLFHFFGGAGQPRRQEGASYMHSAIFEKYEGSEKLPPG